YSSSELSEKSLIGNTDLKTASSPMSIRPPSGFSTWRNWSYEVFWTSMRLGILAISTILPKFLRSLLRPVNERVILASFSRSKSTAYWPESLQNQWRAPPTPLAGESPKGGGVNE